MKKNEVFQVRLKYECEKIGKSINQIERELGYPRNSLHNYKEDHIPSGRRLLEIADYFKVSPKYLLGDEEEVKIDGSVQPLFQMMTSKQKLEIYNLCESWIINIVKSGLISNN